MTEDEMVGLVRPARRQSRLPHSRSLLLPGREKLENVQAKQNPDPLICQGAPRGCGSQCSHPFSVNPETESQAMEHQEGQVVRDRAAPKWHVE